MTFALLAASLVLGIDPSTGTGRRQSQGFGENPLVLIGGVMVGTLAFHLVLLTMLQLVGLSPDWLNAGARVIVPRIVFNLVLMPFVYRLLGRLDRRTRREGYIL